MATPAEDQGSSSAQLTDIYSRDAAGARASREPRTYGVTATARFLTIFAGGRRWRGRGTVLAGREV